MSDKFIDELVEYQKGHFKEISCRLSEDGRFRVFKYTKMVHFNGRWNKFSRVCRGLVIDESNEIVSYPFDKFFNLGIEHEADHFDDAEIVYALQKINGFLAIVSKYKGELIINTAGSFNPEYIEQIMKFIDKKHWLDVLSEDFTYMFECVSNDCDHVVKENIGLTLIGFREKKIGSNVHYKEDELKELSNKLGCFYSKSFMMSLYDLKKLSEEIDFEGFVIRSLDGKRIAKMKGRKFLFKRFLSYMNEKNLDKLVLDETVDEEFRDIVKYIVENKEFWKSMTHQDRVLKIKKFF